jgi:hypothetical protein
VCHTTQLYFLQNEQTSEHPKRQTPVSEMSSNQLICSPVLFSLLLAPLSCLHYIISLASQMDVCCKVSMRKKIYHGDWCGLKACEIFTGDTCSAKSP